MKIILEFTDDEARQAEQAYRGPQYASAIEDSESSCVAKESGWRLLNKGKDT